MATHSFPLKNRREVISAIGITPIAALAAASGISSAAMGSGLARGRVLSAADVPVNGVGSRAGIAGVMVSNGRDVVVTNSEGEWQLSANAGDMLFVIKPRNWTYLERTGVPRFAHRYDPELSAAQTVLDFHLRPQSEDGEFDVLLLADTQAANEQELDYVRKELAHGLRGIPAAFAINHGDIMGDDLGLLGAYRTLLEDTGVVWHHCPGNHDMDLDSTSNELAFETWCRIIGPSHYAFQYAGATFIVLNNVDYFGKGATPEDGRLYRGRIGNEQLTFVANVLRHVPKDALVVVSMHIPLVSFDDPACAADNTADRKQLMTLLSAHPHTVSFSGHSHTTEHHYLGASDGYSDVRPHHHHVLTAFCGSWWGGPLNVRGVPIADSRDGSPRGFHVLSIRGNAYQTRFVAMGDVEYPHLRVSVTAADETQDAGRRSIVIDVFDGGPRTRITCEPGGSSWPIELSRAAIADPHIVASYAEHKNLLKPWVTPARSSHIWEAEVPHAAGHLGYVVCISNEYGLENFVSVTV